MPTIHVLKCWPEPFQSLMNGNKTHEVRKDDRGYTVGDTLWLREWDPAAESYTGRVLACTVTNKTAGGSFGLPPDVCVMSVRWGTCWTSDEIRAAVLRQEAAARGGA